MTGCIADWDGANPNFTVTNALAYLDSLTLFCYRRLPNGVLGSLRKEYGSRLIVNECKIPAFKLSAPARKRSFVTIHQPTKATVMALNAIPSGIFVVNAVHVAIDFLTANPNEAESSTAFLAHYAVQKWRRHGQQSRREMHTQYWKRARKAPRNIALYGDMPSKTGLGACAHFELRFTGAAACKRMCLGDLTSIAAGIDPMALLMRQTKIAKIDPHRLNRAIEKIVRKTKRSGRYPRMTVNGIKQRVQRLLVRGLQDEGRPLDENSLEKARTQSLWDSRPGLRGCLTSPISWDDLIPQPTWRWL